MSEKPNVEFAYYALLEDVTGNLQTPKYKLSTFAGYYAPMLQLRGRDGNIYFYLNENQSEKKSNTMPPMKLQVVKTGQNFTGLKGGFVDGGLSGFAYGYPDDNKTFSKKNKPNPFYECKDDGFLFIITKSQDEARPSQIELLVIPNGKVLISGYCRALEKGFFDEALTKLRISAINNLL